MPDAFVAPIVPGSLIVLRGVEFEDFTLEQFMDGIERACGHRKFVVLQIGEIAGEARVFGPDELVGWLQVALGVEIDLPSAVDGHEVINLGRIEMGSEPA